MTIIEIIDELYTSQIYPLQQKRDGLLVAYGYGDELPEGHDNWEQVDATIDNIDVVLSDLYKAVESLSKNLYL